MATADGRRLVLVKHALPEVLPGVPARAWRLGDGGRRGAAALSAVPALRGAGAIVSSREPKALETAGILAACAGVAVEPFDGLHEHDREGVPFLARDAFEAAVARFFTEPDALAFGRETARQAGARFASAIDAVLAARPAGDVVVVAHGTVMSLFVAARAGVEPFPLWRRLGLPSCVVLALPTFALLDVVADVSPSTETAL